MKVQQLKAAIQKANTRLVATESSFKTADELATRLDEATGRAKQTFKDARRAFKQARRNARRADRERKLAKKDFDQAAADR